MRFYSQNKLMYVKFNRLWLQSKRFIFDFVLFDIAHASTSLKLTKCCIFYCPVPRQCSTVEHLYKTVLNIAQALERIKIL